MKTILARAGGDALLHRKREFRAWCDPLRFDWSICRKPEISKLASSFCLRSRLYGRTAGLRASLIPRLARMQFLLLSIWGSLVRIKPKRNVTEMPTILNKAQVRACVALVERCIDIVPRH